MVSRLHQLLENDALPDGVLYDAHPAAVPGDRVLRLMDDGTFYLQIVKAGGVLERIADVAYVQEVIGGLSIPEDISPEERAFLTEITNGGPFATAADLEAALSRIAALEAASSVPIISVTRQPVLDAVAAGDVPGDVAVATTPEATASDGSTVTITGPVLRRGGTDWDSGTGWVSAAAAVGEIVRARWTLTAPGAATVYVYAQTTVVATLAVLTDPDLQLAEVQYDPADGPFDYVIEDTTDYNGTYSIDPAELALGPVYEVEPALSIQGGAAATPGAVLIPRPGVVFVNKEDIDPLADPPHGVTYDLLRGATVVGNEDPYTASVAGSYSFRETVRTAKGLITRTSNVIAIAAPNHAPLVGPAVANGRIFNSGWSYDTANDDLVLAAGSNRDLAAVDLRKALPIDMTNANTYLVSGEITVQEACQLRIRPQNNSFANLADLRIDLTGSASPQPFSGVLTMSTATAFFRLVFAVFHTPQTNTLPIRLHSFSAVVQ